MTETRLTIEQLQDIRSTIYGDEQEYLNSFAPRILAQLIATMQREAQLREVMLEAHRLIANGEIFEATAILKITGEARSEYPVPSGD